MKTKNRNIKYEKIFFLGINYKAQIIYYKLYRHNLKVVYELHPSKALSIAKNIHLSSSY